MASPLFLYALILFCYNPIAAAGDKQGFVVVPSSKFETKDICSTSRVATSHGSNRATMQLVHRHGPCAPSPSTDKPSFTEMLRRHRAREQYITKRAATASIPTHLGGSVDSLEYVVTVSLGTPAVSQVVLIDTGSDLSWVQCAPCGASACYRQKDPMFDPRNSSTYAPFPCRSDACKNLAADGYDNGCTANGTLCGYGIQYGDGSTTTGVYSDETLTLAAGVVVENFHFGCGDHQGQPFDKYDGLLGLGGAPESLVSQTSAVYGGAFSYCLPPVNADTGFLSLGAPSNTSGFAFTPMTRDPDQATFYMVKFAGISVGGKQLSIPASAFSGGVIIDSGTVVTAIPTTAYNVLRSAFRAAMAAYPLVPNDDLDTCYNLTGHGNVTVPSVALTFTGGTTVDLVVPDGVLLGGCLAFTESGPDDGFGIIGNVNQRTLEVLFDADHGKVGFRSGAC